MIQDEQVQKGQLAAATDSGDMQCGSAPKSASVESEDSQTELEAPVTKAERKRDTMRSCSEEESSGQTHGCLTTGKPSAHGSIWSFNRHPT